MNTAMLLCAGFGTRMQALTREIPKPMLPVSGKPILEYTIGHLSKLGIHNIVINLHYLSEKIVSYFGDGKKFNVHIDYIYENEPLGTAGAVKNAEKYLISAGSFLVLYGDVVANENYSKVSEFNESRSDAVATIVLHERNKSNSVVEMDKERKIIRFIERPAEEVKDKKQNWVNSGLYCFKKNILEYILAGVYSDFPKNIFPKLVSEGSLYGYPLSGYRCAVDSPERYQSLKEDFARLKLF